MKSHHRIVIFSIISLLFIFSIVQDSQAKTLYGTPPDSTAPLIQINKSASETTVKLGTNITVLVNITNWSVAWAYNLTITEPLFNDWALTYFQGWEKYQWVEVGPGASISYNYTMNIKKEGNYVIGATKIDYVDENSTSFISFSQDISINVFVVAPPPSQQSIWNNIFIMSLVILLIPVGVLILNKMVWRKK